MYPSPGVVERIGPDWDWIWIDSQHGQIDYSDALALVRACNLVGVKAFVRVAGHERGPIAVALDTGADGIIVPQVENADDARAIVKAAKFPPLGERSYGARRCIDREGRLYVEEANIRTEVICQIESPDALERAEEIAAVPGVDGLFLGPDDYMLRQGLSMNTPRTEETLGEAFEKLMAACKQHGKKGMAVGIGDGVPQLCSRLGYHYIVGGTDVSFLANTSTTKSAELRKALEASANPTATSDGKPSFY